MSGNFNPHPYVRDDIRHFVSRLRSPTNFNPHPYVRDDLLSAAVNAADYNIILNKIKGGSHPSRRDVD